MPLPHDSTRKKLLIRLRNILSFAGLWTRDNQKLLEEYGNLKLLASVFEVIAIHREQPIQLPRGFRFFEVPQERLTQSILEAILKHFQLGDLLNIFKVLNRTYYVFLLSPANLEKIVNHPNPDELAVLLEKFADTGFLNQDILDALMRHPDSIRCLYVLNTFHRFNFFYTLPISRDTPRFTEALAQSNRNGRATQEDYYSYLRSFVPVVEEQSFQNTLNEADEPTDFLEVVKRNHWISDSVLSSL